MPLLVTSASGVNGNGFGTLLAFGLDGKLRGTFFDDERIVDPRGLAIDPKENLLFLNSGADRVLAISPQVLIVRDTGRIEGLNPGGGTFGPDGRYYVGLRTARTIIALSTTHSKYCRPRSYLFPEDLLSVTMAGCFSPQESVAMGKATIRYWPLPLGCPQPCAPLGSSPIPN